MKNAQAAFADGISSSDYECQTPDELLDQPTISDNVSPSTLSSAYYSVKNQFLASKGEAFELPPAYILTL